MHGIERLINAREMILVFGHTYLKRTKMAMLQSSMRADTSAI